MQLDLFHCERDRRIENHLMHEGNSMKKIPERLYNKIVSVMPITSVEAIIMDKENSILVLKRNNAPVKGEWWFPGGRVRKGETLEEALIREVREETGLDIEVKNIVGVYTRRFPERHDISIVFLCSIKAGDLRLNQEHSDVKFLRIKKAMRELHPELQTVLKDSIGDK
jgi:8-oxo-dGTP diphosphatase